MPITSKGFARTTIVLLALGFLALVGIVATTFVLAERTQGYFSEVLEAREARAATVDLRNAIYVAETAQRGFLIAGSEIYLAPLDGARATVERELERLGNILAAYPQATEPMARLREVVAGKFAEMDETIALRRSGDIEEMLAIVRTNRGKALMDEANVFFTGLINAADDRLVEGVGEQRSNALLLRWVTIVGGLLIIAVVAGSAGAVLLYTRDLDRARAEVTALNASLENRVNERTADLARANDEIQRFAYIVTHDLRAPLVNIMGFTSELESGVASMKELLDRQPEDAAGDPVVEQARLAANEDLPEAIGFIRSSTRKMDGLINAILKLSREGRRALRPERIDLAAVFSGATDAIRHQLDEAGGTIDLDLKVDTITTDRMGLEQVIGNLLDNAVKYRARQRPLALAVRALVASGNRIAIEITDNGRGIAEQDLERVFELFRRAGEQDQAGEGIGLASVRAMVRRLGGDISVSSKLGEGTTFRIVLPRFLVVSEGQAA